jgi:molybdopterin molybdotransferase
MLSVDEARARILESIGPLGSERLAIGECGGRILAADTRARRALPPWDNSAMDGYAVRAADLPGSLPIAATIAAGAATGAVHEAGTATRIMTGAPLPAGADCVVIREVVEVAGEIATIDRPGVSGDNVRRAGEDIERDAVAVRAGTRLDAAEIGLLAAVGYPELEVGRRPRVAILSTGDELVDVSDAPPPDKIINSNAYALSVQVAEAGGIAERRPIASDNLVATTEAIAEALAGADVLITSGGVSVGDYDVVKQAFADAGVDIGFWKVAMKPGKPLAFGLAGDKPVFGLPGNPVSSMVSFELFARPALMAMQGATELARGRAPVVIAGDYRKDPGRAHYLRATLRRRDGILEAVPLAKQGSGMLTSMTGIDALVVVGADTTEVVAGEILDALILRPR